MDCPRRRVRVSVASLLRVRDLDLGVTVLVNARQHVLAPLGGVVNYRLETAGEVLAAMDWQPERPPGLFGLTDLRGSLPLDGLATFRSWLASGEGRESGEQCLRREFDEEVVEAGCDFLLGRMRPALLWHVMTVVEEPNPAQEYFQLRHLEIYELGDDSRSADLRSHLLSAAASPECPGIVAVTPGDAAQAALGSLRVGTQARYVAW